MSRSLTVVLAAVVLLVLGLAPDASAQARIGAHVGINTEGSDLFLGANAQFGLDLGGKEALGQVGIEIYPFIDNVFQTRINGNALFPLLQSAGAELYGGGGLAITLIQYDLPEGSPLDSSDSDFGINLVAGAILSGADRNYRPFVELNQTIGGGTDFAIRGGVFFKVGK